MHETAYATGPQGLKAYPRGFLGARLPDIVSKALTTREDNLGFTQILATKTKKTDTIEVHNPSITKLYNDYTVMAPDVLSFEFKERVFTAGLLAFGTKTFSEWFRATWNSPHLSEDGLDFLEDTVSFLSGEPRGLAMINWQRMISPAATRLVTRPMSAKTEKFFRDPQNGNWPLHAIFAKWLQRPEGFEDLLGTLYILFGPSD